MECGRIPNPSLSGTLKKAKRGCRQKSQYFKRPCFILICVTDEKSFISFSLFLLPTASSIVLLPQNLEAALNAKCSFCKPIAWRLAPPRHSVHRWHALFTDHKFRKLKGCQFLLVSTLYLLIQHNLFQTHSQLAAFTTIGFPPIGIFPSIIMSWSW